MRLIFPFLTTKKYCSMSLKIKTKFFHYVVGTPLLDPQKKVSWNLLLNKIFTGEFPIQMSHIIRSNNEALVFLVGRNFLKLRIIIINKLIYFTLNRKFYNLEKFDEILSRKSLLSYCTTFCCFTAICFPLIAFLLNLDIIFSGLALW